MYEIHNQSLTTFRLSKWWRLFDFCLPQKKERTCSTPKRRAKIKSNKDIENRNVVGGGLGRRVQIRNVGI